MKRSEINAALKWARALLDKNNIRLPLYAYWSTGEWKAHAEELTTIRKVMLGWDITDFGMGDFNKVGAVLYTVRNGSLEDKSIGVPYCEKYILMRTRLMDESPTTFPSAFRAISSVSVSRN